MAASMKSAPASASKEKLLAEQLRFQKKLNAITNRIHSAKDTNDILLNLQVEILSLFDADRITIYAVEWTRRQIVSRFKTGNEISEIKVPIDCESVAGYCALSGNLLNIRNVYDRQELRANHPKLGFARGWDQMTGYKTKQVLAAPISHNKTLLGVIQLINKKNGDRFTEEDRSSVQEIAKVLGVAFFNNRKAAQKSRPTRFDLLVANNIISGNDLAEAMSRARVEKKSVESVLMSDFQVTKEDVGKSLANFYKVRFVPFDSGMAVPTGLLRGLRPGYLRSNGFVPVGQSGEKAVVAMQDPNYLPARDAVKRIMPSKRFEFAVSLKEDIQKMIDLFFDVRRAELLEKSGSIEEILGRLEPGGEDPEEEFGRITEEDSAIVQLVNKMIVDAYDRGASDIHIEPRQGRSNALIRFRVDGRCQAYQTIPYAYKRAMVSRLKIMSDLDISERRLPQDGKIKFKRFAPLDIELRVATIPTSGQNEDVVLRILTAGDPTPLERMGMRERDYEAFLEMISKPYGIVLVVGPTGSGKTTTLHSALAHINKPETKIWTAEDPVEITQEGLRQVQVRPKIGLDFATAMRAFLRADPDVIMVGEMRDRETVSTGIEASLTGHLVLSTLHTNSAPETVSRLLDMGMDPFNFADALLGVLAQRLVRTLCSKCKENYHPTREEFDGLVRSYEGDFESMKVAYGEDVRLYRAKGCPECGNSGYRGRTGIYELLIGSDKMKALVQSRAKTEEIRAEAVQEGMTTLMQDGIRRVLLGQTDLVQVRKVCIK